MEKFLKQILDGGMAILLIAPPVMKPGVWIQSETQIKESHRLSQLYKDLAERLRIDFADAEEWNIELSFDGVHFTESGHKSFAQGVKKHLEEKYHES